MVEYWDIGIYSNRQMWFIYGRDNIIIDSFEHCIFALNKQFFKNYCNNFYCFIWRVFTINLIFWSEDVQHLRN